MTTPGRGDAELELNIASVRSHHSATLDPESDA